MPSVWQALRRGESARERRLQLERAHERFVESETADPALRTRLAESLDLRDVVLDSWLRARERTIDPERVPGEVAMSADELGELQLRHPIARVLPVVHRLLLEEATESGFIVAVGDAEGRLLWVDGDRKLRSKAEDMGFRAGADWSEAAVGTSAPGSALALDHSLQVLGAEHYNRFVHQWSCTAAPVHDPVSGAILGVIDVSGGDEVASPHLMPLVEATLAAVEAELKLEALRARMQQDRPPNRRSAMVAGSGGRATKAAAMRAAPRLVVLGRDPAVLEFAHGVAELSGRHAEILLALARAPQGLAAAVLAEQVYGAPRSEQTLRAEMVRLRKWADRHSVPLELGSRPYRLAGGLRVDAFETLAALSRGAHRLALAEYEGPVLPSSDAPVSLELRGEVDGAIRESMLQSAAADTLYTYAQTWARDDREVWETLLRVLPPLSPKRAQVVARLDLILDET